MNLSQRLGRIPLAYRVAAAGSFAVGVIGMLVVALIVGLSASHRTSHVANCVNDTLGDRNGKSQQYDSAVADAFDLFGQALTGAVDGDDPAVRKRFLADVATVHSVAAYRKSHPLGQC